MITNSREQSSNDPLLHLDRRMKHSRDSLHFGGNSSSSTSSGGSDSWFAAAAIMNLDEFLEQVAYHDNLSGNMRSRSSSDAVVHVDFR